MYVSNSCVNTVRANFPGIYLYIFSNNGNSAFVGYEEFCRSRRVLKPSEICRILHILQKPNSIIALFFIQNIFFAQTCKDVNLLAAISLYVNNTTSSPGFLGQWFNNFDVNGSIICSGLNMTLAEYDKILCKFGQQFE